MLIAFIAVLAGSLALTTTASATATQSAAPFTHCCLIP
jgi:hypothetical protein